jgi:hypothetical protein
LIGRREERLSGFHFFVTGCHAELINASVEGVKGDQQITRTPQIPKNIFKNLKNLNINKW